MIAVLLLCCLAAGAVLVWPARAAVGPTGRDGRAGLGTAIAPRSWLRRLARGGGSAQERSAELQLIDGLAAALEAGLPVPRAVGLAVSEGAAGWAGLLRAATEGQPLGPAWERLARHSRSPTLASVSRAWRVASLTGAPLASALRVSAHAGRERHRLARAVEVATAGPRATVAVLTLLPLAGAGLAAVLGVGPSSLYGHPIAQASAGTGALLILLGQVWVRRMVADVLRRAR